MPAVDKFSSYGESLISSPSRSFAIVLDNDNDLPFVTKSITANSTGSVRLIMADDTDPVTISVVEGMQYPRRVKRVLSTGTTATNLVGDY